MKARSLLIFVAGAMLAAPGDSLASGICSLRNPVACEPAYPENATSVAVTRDGSVLVYDASRATVARVGRDGTVVRVAGAGTAGFSGDGGPATAAWIPQDAAIAATRDGGFLIADADTHRVRKVSRAGIITTLAGTGVPGAAGDGGPAAVARLMAPSAIAAMPDGGFVVADAATGRVRRVDAKGTITTIARLPVAGLHSLGDTSVFSVAALLNGRVAFSNGTAIALTSRSGAISRVYPVPRDPALADGTITALAAAPDDTLRFAYVERGSDHGSVQRLRAGGAAARVIGRDVPDCPADAPEGSFAPAFSLYNPTALAVGADQTFYVRAVPEYLRAFGPDGQPLGFPLEGEGALMAFAHDGQPLGFPFGRPVPQVPCPPPTGRIRPVGPGRREPPPDWQTFLISRASATASGVSLTLVTTVSGTARISVTAGRRVLSPVTTTSVRAGTNTLRVRMKLKPGAYTIKVAERAARSKKERTITTRVTRAAR